MIDSPVPDQWELLGSLAVLLGAPAAFVLTILAVITIAGYVTGGVAAARFSAAAARRVADGYVFVNGQIWGRLAHLGIAQTIAVAAVYVATRWGCTSRAFRGIPGTRGRGQIAHSTC